MNHSDPSLAVQVKNRLRQDWRRQELFRVRLEQCRRNYDAGGEFVDDDGYTPEGIKPHEFGFRSDDDDMNTDYYDEDGYDLAGFDRDGRHRNGIDYIVMIPPY